MPLGIEENKKMLGHKKHLNTVDITTFSHPLQTRICHIFRDKFKGGGKGGRKLTDVEQLQKGEERENSLFERLRKSRGKRQFPSFFLSYSLLFSHKEIMKRERERERITPSL